MKAIAHTGSGNIGYVMKSLNKIRLRSGMAPLAPDNKIHPKYRSFVRLFRPRRNNYRLSGTNKLQVVRYDRIQPGLLLSGAIKYALSCLELTHFSVDV